MTKLSTFIYFHFLWLNLFICEAYAIENISNDPFVELTPENDYLCQQHTNNQRQLSDCLEQRITRVNIYFNQLILQRSNQLQELARLTNSEQTLRLFDQANADFITYRESVCKYRYQSMMPGSGAAIEYKRCILEQTGLRIAQLKVELN